ncbi:MAG: hypothetical protein R3B47_15745 [Bacteroidia bacterium]
MKQLTFFVLCFLSLSLAFANASQIPQKQALTQQDWLTLKPREIEQRSGQRMGFFQRMALKIVQKKVMKAKEKPKTWAGKWSMRLYPATLVFGLIGTVLTLITGAYNPVLYFFFFGGLLGFASLILGIIGHGKGDFRGKEGWKLIGPVIGGIFGLFSAFVAGVAAYFYWFF